MNKSKYIMTLLMVTASMALTACGIKPQGGADKEKPGNLFTQLADDVANDNSSDVSYGKELHLSEEELKVVDYPYLNTDGEFSGLLKVFYNNTDTDLKVMIDYEGWIGEPYMLFVPAHDSNNITMMASGDITTPEGLNYKAQVYEYDLDYEYDRFDQYEFTFMEEKNGGVAYIQKYIGDDPRPFDMHDNDLKVVYFDENDNVVYIGKSITNMHFNVHQGDEITGLSAFFRKHEISYDHYEVFYKIGQKFYDVTDYENSVTIKAITPFSFFNKESELLEVTNNNDYPVDATLSGICYNADHEVIGVMNYIDTGDIEPHSSIYIKERVTAWVNEDLNLNDVASIECRLNYLSKRDSDDKYKKDVSQYVTMSNVEYVHNEYAEDRIEYILTNNYSDEVKYFVTAIIYDAEGNAIDAYYYENSLDAEEENDGRAYVNDETAAIMDHYEISVRAVITNY